MRSLADLLGSAEGRSFLASRGVTLDADSYVELLRPPARPELARLLDRSEDAAIVYVAHQAHVDLGASVASKFRGAAALPDDAAVAVALWLDMDRTGSDKASTTIAWPLAGREETIRLVPQRLRDREPRFIPMDRARLEAIVAQLRTWIDETVDDGVRRDDARTRLDRLAAVLLDDELVTLAEVNVAVATHLLAEHEGVRMPAVMVSTLVATGALSSAIEYVLRLIDDVILVFNTAVDELIALDLDPLVHPLAEDYLPLSYACDRCGARRRLTHERRGDDHGALLSCSCGASRRFHLGSGAPSLGELAASDRWSTDVTLPIYLNDVASGVVAGRSSVMYGLVLGEVVDKVLGRSPVPTLIPDDLLATIAGPARAPGLVYAYLVGT